MISGKYKITGRITPGLVLAYLFFLLFPHFDAVSHVHEGGESTHDHGFLSAHDVALERAALEAVPQGAPNNEVASKDVPPILRPSLGNLDRGLTPSSAAGHAHFQEDPNLPGLNASPAPELRVSSGPVEPAPAKAMVPTLAAQAAPARAPPRAS